MATADEFVSRYHRGIRMKVIFTLLCLVVSVAVFFVTLTLGKYQLSLSDCYEIFITNLLGQGNSYSVTDNYVIWDMRIPRALMAIFVGAGLAVAGAVMQNLLMNPLAEPFTMGISSGAFLGAVLALTNGIFILPFVTGESGVVINAFVLSLAPVAMIVIISRIRKTTATSMILCGIAIMYIFSSISTLLMVMADPEHLSDAYAWRVGSLGKATWDNIGIVIPFIVVLIIILTCMAGKINALALGDRGASTLGTDPYKTRLVCLFFVAVLTSFCVSFTGTIGFVGLVVPHMARIFIGSNNKYLIPSCIGFGAMFLLVMDSLAKILGDTGMPVGVVTSLIGGPIFVYLLIQRKRKIWY